jgi:hypothetical protein
MSYAISENRRKFAAVLAKLVRPDDATAALDALLLMLPALEDIPEPVFTRPGDLAAEIAKGFTGVPNLGRLHKALAGHKKANVSTLPAELPGGDDQALSLEDRIKLLVFQQQRASGLTNIRGLDFRDRLTTRLAIERRYDPRVFAYVCRTDPEAEAIAMRQGWLEDASERRQPTAEESAAVAEKREEAIAAIKAAQIPGQTHDRPVIMEPRHNIEVPPDKLAALRAKAGINLPEPTVKVPVVPPKPVWVATDDPEIVLINGEKRWIPEWAREAAAE